MPNISDMPSPDTLTGLELLPGLQGGGVDGNVGIPLLATGAPFGGAVLSLRVPMTADRAATADADPGAGRVRWNNAAPHLATMLFVDDVDGDGASLSAALGSLALGGYVYLQGRATSDARDNLQRWQVTSIAAASGYVKIGVSLQAAGGAIADADTLEMTLQQPLPVPGVNRDLVHAVVSASAVTTLDASLGNYFRTSMTENTSLTIVNVPQACTLSLSVVQGAVTARTMAWPASFRWPAGHNKLISTALSARDRVIMTTDDYGATWDCALARAHAA